LFAPPGIEAIGMLDRKAIDKAFNLGYENACNEMPKLQKLLKKEWEAAFDYWALEGIGFGLFLRRIWYIELKSNTNETLFIPPA